MNQLGGTAALDGEEPDMRDPFERLEFAIDASTMDEDSLFELERLGQTWTVHRTAHQTNAENAGCAVCQYTLPLVLTELAQGRVSRDQSRISLLARLMFHNAFTSAAMDPFHAPTREQSLAVWDTVLRPEVRELWRTTAVEALEELDALDAR